MKNKKNIGDESNFNSPLGVGGSLWFFLICLILGSCSGTKFLPKGDKLYTGAKIVIVSTEKVNSKSMIQQTQVALSPKPNSSYLGMRPQLWLDRIAGTNPKSKFKKWLKNNGE